MFGGSSWEYACIINNSKDQYNCVLHPSPKPIYPTLAPTRMPSPWPPPKPPPLPLPAPTHSLTLSPHQPPPPRFAIYKSTTTCVKPYTFMFPTSPYGPPSSSSPSRASASATTSTIQSTPPPCSMSSNRCLSIPPSFYGSTPPSYLRTGT